MFTLKTSDQIREIAEGGKILAEVLTATGEKIADGMTTKELDTIAGELIEKAGAQPAFLGYRGFAGNFCISVNDEVVHGIPSRKKILRKGDLVTLDGGVIYKGWYTDAALTFGVGKLSREAAKLATTCREALRVGIAAIRPGARLGLYSHAVQQYVESHGYGVVRELVGHGIGRELHEEPQIPNFGLAESGPVVRVGMVMALEPMITAGRYDVALQDDGWTITTQDGSLAAHVEHTVAVTEGGVEILTSL